MADDGGLPLELTDGVDVVILTCLMRLWAKTSGSPLASSTVSGSSGQPGASVV
jgi:hypothetical protein